MYYLSIMQLFHVNIAWGNSKLLTVPETGTNLVLHTFQISGEISRTSHLQSIQKYIFYCMFYSMKN